MPLIVTITAVIGMLCLMLYRRNRFGISLPKTVWIFLPTILLGVSATCVLFFIETGKWGGMSFYGAVFTIPLVVLLLAPILKLPTDDVMDFIAPSGLLMFAVLKLNCAVTGCCFGQLLWHKAGGDPVYFPSPVVETVTTLLLVALLLYAERKEKTQGKLYPISLITYGSLRFVLNFFRSPEQPFLFGLQKGHVWSLAAIVLGAVWLLLITYRKIDRQYQEIQDTTAE